MKLPLFMVRGGSSDDVGAWLSVCVIAHPFWYVLAAAVVLWWLA